MAGDEIYPGAPLVSVAFELRHPPAEPLLGTQRTELQRKLASQFPLMRSHQNIMQTVDLSPTGPVTQSVTEEFPRFVNRARTTAISVLQSSLLVETTDYPGWSTFRDHIEFACQVRNSVAPIYGIERLGLRYIDEVRAGEPENLNWADWINSSLLGGSIGDGISLPLETWQGALVYGSEPGQGLVLRYGPGIGFVTDPGAELRRKTSTAPGPFFMLDIDSFWLPSEEVPEYRSDDMLSRADELHTPVRLVFESSITNRYREEVLRK